jgi:hypothetical protein
MNVVDKNLYKLENMEKKLQLRRSRSKWENNINKIGSDISSVSSGGLQWLSCCEFEPKKGRKYLASLKKTMGFSRRILLHGV